MIQRKQISRTEIDTVFEAARQHCNRCLVKHGTGSFVGKHEILGNLVEEMHELTLAVHSNEVRGRAGSVREELLDVAITALFGIASIDFGDVS